MYEILHRIDEPLTDLTGLVLNHTTTRAGAWILATGTWQIPELVRQVATAGDLTPVRHKCGLRRAPRRWPAAAR